MKVGEINTAKESFTAEIFVQAKWREPSLDGTNTNSVSVNCTTTGTRIEP